MNANNTIIKLQERGILLSTGEINTDKINFISGAVTGPLIKTIWEMADFNPDALNHLYSILSGLYEQGKENEIMEILHLLYDTLSLEFPESVAMLSSQPKARSCFLSEMLVDMDEIVEELVTGE